MWYVRVYHMTIWYTLWPCGMHLWPFGVLFQNHLKNQFRIFEYQKLLKPWHTIKPKCAWDHAPLVRIQALPLLTFGLCSFGLILWHSSTPFYSYNIYHHGLSSYTLFGLPLYMRRPFDWCRESTYRTVSTDPVNMYKMHCCDK